MRRAGPGEVLERRYRRLLACYPSAYRAAYGEEMLAVAMAAAGPGRRWPDPGEAADLIVSGLRRRLGSVREAGREPAWRDAAATVAVIGPVLMAAFAARHLLTPVSGIHGWQYFGPVPAGGITVAVAWAAVAVAAVLGWRRLALAGCSALLIGLTCDFALAAGGNPYAWGASWWEVVFAAVIAASALLAVKSEHRLVTWPALTAIAMAAMLLAALPAITAATLTPPLSPGDTMNAAFKAWASNVITMMNIQAWLNDAVPAGLALVLLVVIARLRPAVRPRVIILIMPVIAAMALDTWGYGGILGTEYPLVVYPSRLAAPQWPAALAVAPVLCFLAGLTVLTWYERMLRRGHTASLPA